MIDYLATSVENPMFYGYMEDCEFQETIREIKKECGNRVGASVLTEKLKENGLEPNTLTRSQLDLIDKEFDCLDS